MHLSYLGNNLTIIINGNPNRSFEVIKVENLNFSTCEFSSKQQINSRVEFEILKNNQKIKKNLREFREQF